MKITGQRTDGALYLSMGGGLAVILKGEKVSPTLDESVVEGMGPWLPGDNSFHARRATARALELARVASLDYFSLNERATLLAKAEEYKQLLSLVDPTMLASNPEHPFDHCMTVIVPAMEKQGKAPDDPKAFCGWYKAEKS